MYFTDLQKHKLPAAHIIIIIFTPKNILIKIRSGQGKLQNLFHWSNLRFKGGIYTVLVSVKKFNFYLQNTAGFILPVEQQ